MQDKVASNYPGKKVVTLADLQADDKGFFQKNHNNSFLGLVKVDFYGDRKPTLALVLIGNGEGKDSSVLVVAHQVEADWNISTLATGGPTVPVVESATGRILGGLWQRDDSSDQTRKQGTNLPRR